MFMIRETLKKVYKPICWGCLAFLALYGLGRLYYAVTGGFTLSNITYDIPYDSRWNISYPKAENLRELEVALGQNYRYLGKGCQSYVFQSEDGKYVLKFIKYQRFRPRPWLEYMTFIPGMKKHYSEKVEQKRAKLDSLFVSWKIAYENLQPETGVIYVHLNKSNDLNKNLVIFDKIGFKHLLALDDFEFLIQRKAKMLCPTLDGWMKNGEIEKAKELITALLDRIISEYDRGFADNDHALMQNTGVLDQQPVHVDVGQFVKNNRVFDKSVRHQELFNKTWKFRKWLEKHHPLLADHLVLLMRNYMGDESFNRLAPKLNKAEMGILSHQI